MPPRAESAIMKIGLKRFEVRLQCIGDVLDGSLPLLDSQTVAFVVGDEATLVLAVDLDDLLLGLTNEFIFLSPGFHIRDGNGEMEALVEYL